MAWGFEKVYPRGGSTPMGMRGVHLPYLLYKWTKSNTLKSWTRLLVAPLRERPTSCMGEAKPELSRIDAGGACRKRQSERIDCNLQLQSICEFNLKKKKNRMRPRCLPMARLPLPHQLSGP